MTSWSEPINQTIWETAVYYGPCFAMHITHITSPWYTGESYPIGAEFRIVEHWSDGCRPVVHTGNALLEVRLDDPVSGRIIGSGYLIPDPTTNYTICRGDIYVSIPMDVSEGSHQVFLVTRATCYDYNACLSCIDVQGSCGGCA